MTSDGSGNNDVWPELMLADWSDTRDTLHRWSQVVGKIRLALETMVNHWWQVPLYVTAHGLTTSLMPAGNRGLEIEFDFSEHILRLDTTDGTRRQLALEPRSVADFYGEVMATLDEIGIKVRILGRPVEIADATPFAEDDQHCSYDPDAARRFWAVLVHADRILQWDRRGLAVRT